jgi:hypothetical protein
MKAVVTLELDARTPEEAQRVLSGICEELKGTAAVRECRFVIEAPEGTITEKCILVDGNVFA